MTRIITVTSGKGGVGKTNICTNLAIQLAALGHRTCVFDADLGLANINIILGIYPEYTLEHVILQSKPLADIIIKLSQGVDIIPGSSGVEKMANIGPEHIDQIINSFSLLQRYDFLIFDTSAGVARNVLSFCLASSEIVIIITPEPTSLTDAYALLKILTLNGFSSSVKVVVNQCKDTAVARQTYSRFKEVVKKYLAIDIQPLGVILNDTHVVEAVKQQKPFSSLFPASIASKCIRTIANNLVEQASDDSQIYGVEAFWKRWISFFRGHLSIDGSPTAQVAAAPACQPQASAPPAPERALPLVAQEPTGTDLDHASAPATSLSTAAIATSQSPEKAREVLPASDSSTFDKKIENAESHANVPMQAIDNNVSPFLLTLSQGLVTISDELRMLRKLFEGNGTQGVSKSRSIDLHPQSDQLRPILLDFEAYAQKQKE